MVLRPVSAQLRPCGRLAPEDGTVEKQVDLKKGSAYDITEHYLLEQSFGTSRLVAVPPLAGMAGVAVFFVSPDNAPRAFSVNQKQVQELAILPVREETDVRAKMGAQELRLDSKTLDFALETQAGGATERVESRNAASRDIKYTYFDDNGLVHAHAANGRLVSGSAYNGQEHLFIQPNSPSTYPPYIRILKG